MTGSYRVAVVGATGAVGGVMLDVLAARAFPAAEVVPFASARSAGRELPQGVVRPLEEDTIQGFDVALFSAGSGVSAEWAPRFAATGCLVIDNSSQWRMSPEIPLVVAEVNPEAIDAHRGIVANPNCSTMQMVVALKPLHDVAGIERLVISTYQSTSGTGVRAVAEMMEQAGEILGGGV
ncbi:MAG: aspartate-semialdehyde dehydrogenase, partial [Solirubrobacteraceae bacterium]|nr:aspartate-semialdehyde dehydrogenase [Solirubrobacteraceae bacterium]